MTPAEFRDILADLELTPAKAAELLGVSRDATYRWQRETQSGRGIPAPVARFLRFLRAAKISSDKVIALLDGDRP
jgi:hypothetical protein